jgi:hypothetical protein
MSLDDDDDALERELSELFGRADPMPGAVLEAGRAAFGWRRLDAELADLLADSALPSSSSDELALARGVEVPLRSVTFGTGRRAIDLDIDVHGEGRTLRGQLAPPAHATIEVQRQDGTTLASVVADGFGRFVAELPSGGTIRLRLTGDSDLEPIETAWITV